MLFPENRNPEDTVYYVGGIILKVMRDTGVTKYDFFELYKKVNEFHETRMLMFLMSLDWLFLIGIAKKTTGGDVGICI